MPAVVVMGIGVAVTVTGFRFLGQRDHTTVQRAFERRASSIAAGLQSSFELPTEVLEGIRSLAAAQGTFSAEEFRRFVDGALERHPAITAIEWAPLVPASERAAFEAKVRESGIPGFRITEQVAGGAMEAAQERELYVPLLFIEPESDAVGFDLVSEPGRRDIAWQARDAGLPRASGRFQMVEDAPGLYSIAVYRPVYRVGASVDTVEERRAALVGFAIAVFRLGTLVERALSADEREGLEIALVDEGAAPHEAVLYQSRGDFDALRGSDWLRWETGFEFAGRRWTMTLARAHPMSYGLTAWITLFAGLLGSVLLASSIGALRTIVALRKDVKAALELGQYTLIDKISKGGMGSVYRAQHTMLRRPTAVKLLKDESGLNAKRFVQEVQITSELTHPNTIEIYDYGRTPDGTFYYAMEYLDGITLEELVVFDGAQPPARVVSILRQTCGALAEAHSVGLIHRDVKPANLMLTIRGLLYDFVKVLDFGLVKKTSGTDAGVTNADAVVGTPLYLSPEAITDGETVDARSDLYALGAVAYFLLTGTDVFSGISVVELCAKHLRSTPEPMSSRGVDVPKELERLILGCLAKDPEQRPASATALSEALAELDVPEWRNADAEAWWNETGKKVLAKVHEERNKALDETDPASKISMAISIRDRRR